MKEETKQILEIVTSMQEEMVTKKDLETGLRNTEIKLSAEIYTATRAMRDDIVALYDEDVELDHKITSSKIDFKSLYKNLAKRVRGIEKHIGLSSKAPSFA